MDKITIVLQDKKTIEELAKDPEVQIKVKDAVIDAIGKRALKISNLQDEIIEKRRKELWDFFFDKSWYGRNLKEEFRTEIRNQAKAEFNDLIRNELQEMKKWIKSAIKEKKEAMSKEVESYDIEGIIREGAEKVIKEKFS